MQIVLIQISRIDLWNLTFLTVGRSTTPKTMQGGLWDDFLLELLSLFGWRIAGLIMFRVFSRWRVFCQDKVSKHGHQVMSNVSSRPKRPKRLYESVELPEKKVSRYSKNETNKNWKDVPDIQEWIILQDIHWTKFQCVSSVFEVAKWSKCQDLRMGKHWWVFKVAMRHLRFSHLAAGPFELKIFLLKMGIFQQSLC